MSLCVILIGNMALYPVNSRYSAEWNQWNQCPNNIRLKEYENVDSCRYYMTDWLSRAIQKIESLINENEGP